MTTSPPSHRAPLLALALSALPALVILPALLGGASCSSSSSGSTTANGGGTSTKSTTGTGGEKAASSTGTGTGAGTTAGTGGGTACPPSMTYGGGETSVAGGSVKAVLVDETGAPVAVGQPLYICGINICSDPAATTANGGATLATNLSMKKPAFKFGDAVTYAEFAIPLTMNPTDFTATGTGKIATAKLGGKPGATIAANMSAQSGDVTLILPAKANIGINELIYDTDDNQKFRAVNVPLTNLGPVLAPVTIAGAPNDFKLVYGVSPSGTTICPAATLTVALSHATTMPNDLGWLPGAAVEFWIMTVDTAQTYAPYAGWAKASDGAVSADGKSVSTVGQGIIDLENFAIRLKN
jgi:hypothetical protein